MAAEVVVSLAVEMLGNLLVEKVVFLKDVKGDVEWVRDELKRMQCFLKDAAMKQSDSERIHNWISEIREVAHDAEDAIEKFVLNVESRGLLQRYACFPVHVYHLNNIGNEIESIRKRLKDIERSRLTYGIQNLGESSLTRSQLEVESRRRLAYWEQDSDVVGLEKDVQLLLDRAILEERGGLSVASIIGMGGIGKSTLAKKIYNHPKIAGEFECRAWVVVSSEFTAEDITKQILEQLGILVNGILESVDDELRRQQRLQEEVYRFLTGKRYFIVLDDVWEPSHWRTLENSFPREGYFIARQMRDQKQATPSSSTREAPIWKWIQKINTIPKIRFFIWKCAKGILPVATNLSRKRVMCDVMCRRCGMEEETAEHILRDCSWSVFYWKASPLRLTIDTSKRQLSLLAWLEEIARCDEQRVHSLFMVLLWTLWKLRNLLIFQNKDIPHKVGLDMAGKLFAELDPDAKHGLSDVRRREMGVWEKPGGGRWKINVDAALKQGNTAGIGAVIRDEQGSVLAARCLSIPICYKVEEVEALACEAGLRLAREFGCNRVILETDCQLIHRLLERERADLSYLGGIIKSIHVEASHFESIIYSWARRDANKMAHSLAFLASSNPLFTSYTGSLPDVVYRGLPSSERFV